MSIVSFLSLNNQEITEHSRLITNGLVINATEVELDSGFKRRYYQSPKRSFSFQWDWLPSTSSMTVDNRKARDYLKSLTAIADKIPMVIKLSAEDGPESLDVYLSSYSETLIRRDIKEGCDYYKVNMTFEEV